MRLSYVLNHAGLYIPTSPNWRTVSGADHRNYIFTVREMKVFLAATLGRPDLEKGVNVKPLDFAGRKGILVFDIHFLDATGHSTLWDGKRTIDQDELDPARLPCTAARLWACP